jgi:endonuclease/exonuclease/phosphatase (EEP) superfamily protein YafD
MVFHYQNFYSRIDVSSPDPNLSVLYANLYWKNDNYEEINRVINEKNADILLFVEFTDLHYKNMNKSIIENYPYSNLIFEEFERPFAGNIIFSKLPLKENSSVVIDGYYSGFVKSIVQHDESEFNVYLVHTSAPVSKEYFHARNKQIDFLSNSIDTDYNSIVIGDFNLSPWSKYYKKLDSYLSSFLNITRFASTNKTWEDIRSKGIIFSHIDHAWISQNFKLSDIEVSKLDGSDHSMVYFELNLKNNE